MSGKHFIDKKPESILDWIAIVCAGIAFYLLLNNLGYFLGGFGALMGILSPFFGGIVIAYILDPMVRFFHAKLLKNSKRWRWVAILLAYLVAVLLIVLLAWLVIPQIVNSIMTLFNNVPQYINGIQVADHGYITNGDAKLKVTQVKKTPKGYFVHTCELLDGTIHVGDEVTASVDTQRRMAICRNHTATHLLQKALREVLGEHVHQAGSYQDDKLTHFDFTHFSAVTPEELRKVEDRVNEKIFEALPVTIQNLPIEEAKKMGAMALFGEKYGSVVRVVDAGGWSTEFCGGTHVTNTAQIGCFKILSESSVAAGIRRIEATTAYGVLNLLDERTEQLAKTAVALKANNLKDAPARAEALTAELKETNKQLDILKAEMASAKIDGLFENAADIDGVRIVSAYLTGTGADTLRDMVDKVRDKAPNAVTVLIGSDGSKTMMAVGVSKNAQARGLKAGALVKKIAAIAGGNGGGKPDFAMAGIRDTSKIDDALNAVPEIVKAEMQ